MNQLNQVVFANIDEQEPWTIDSYIASGCYEAWKNILTNKNDSYKPENIIEKMINNSNVKIQIGGGVRTLDTIDYYLSFGIKKVILGTAAIKDENFDLIFSGLQSDDMGMGQTGVLVGELLGMSTATLAIETEIDKEKIRVKRELESGWFQWVTLGSPASVSIQSGINQPRYPSLKGIMGAKKKEIKIVQSQNAEKNQSIEKVFVPQTSKETEIIDTDLNSTIDRIVEILKSEVKVF